MYVVHCALEKALAATTAITRSVAHHHTQQVVAAAAAARAAGKRMASANKSGGAVVASPTTESRDDALGAARIPQQELAPVLKLFSRRQGFFRSAQLAADTRTLLVVQAREEGQEQGRRAAQQQLAAAATAIEGEGGLPAGAPPPSHASAAYAAYLASLARQCEAADSGEEMQARTGAGAHASAGAACPAQDNAPGSSLLSLGYSLPLARQHAAPPGLCHMQFSAATLPFHRPDADGRTAPAGARLCTTCRAPHQWDAHRGRRQRQAGTVGHWRAALLPVR